MRSISRGRFNDIFSLKMSISPKRLGPLHMSPVDWAGSVTGMNFALGPCEEFQPGLRDEKRSKILGARSGAKFGKQSKHGETQKF